LIHIVSVTKQKKQNKKQKNKKQKNKKQIFNKERTIDSYENIKVKTYQKQENLRDLDNDIGKYIIIKNKEVK
jgi:hypothetical protein